MGKFNVGDFVKFADGITAKDMGIIFTPVDLKKVYRIAMKDGEKTYKLDDVALSCFSFHSAWLAPAKLEVREKAIEIKNVIFNRPATIVFWTDGTKTVVKCGKGEKWDAEKGLAMACAKKLLGNRDGYHEALAKYYKKEGRWQDEMDTEDIRKAVWAGCRKFPLNGENPCYEKCPCNMTNGDKTCFIIPVASRDKLVAMLESFEKAGYWSYEDWGLTHA